mmetsp:Transcript_23016/g.26297  ORF Transcript_23016/g.26297 Transcript_23016/m.26297 type:complete len:154 (+) Transcript_23016:60-521(+)
MFHSIIRSAISINRKIVVAGNNKNNISSRWLSLSTRSSALSSSSSLEEKREDINEKALVASASELLSLFDKKDSTSIHPENDIVYGSAFSTTYVGKYRNKVREAKEAKTNNSITKNTTPAIQFGDPRPSSISADSMLQMRRMKRATEQQEEEW